MVRPLGRPFHHSRGGNVLSDTGCRQPRRYDRRGERHRLRLQGEGEAQRTSPSDAKQRSKITLTETATFSVRLYRVPKAFTAPSKDAAIKSAGVLPADDGT